MSAPHEIEPPGSSVFLTPTAGESRPSQWIDPRTDPQWDERLARAFPTANVFDTAGWASVLHDTYGYTPCYFVERTETSWQILVPFMEVDSWLTGRRGVSLPFSDYCAPLTRDPDAVTRCWETILEFGRKRAWRTMDFRGGLEDLPSATPSITFLGHVVHLEADPARQYQTLTSATRRAIRKATESGLTTTIDSSTADLKAFHELFLGTRKRLGVPPPPQAFFRNIHRHLLARGRGAIVLARRNGRAVAGALFLRFGATVHMKFAASERSAQGLRPNNLVMWTALRHFSEAGAKWMHFGRTSPRNEGLRRFKLGWGANETRLPYHAYDLKRREFLQASDHSTGWITRVGRLLPHSLFRFIGTKLYRHIA